MIEKEYILSQVTMQCIEDALLTSGNSLRTKRDKKNRIRKIGVYGYRVPECAKRKEPKLAIVHEYVWRPNV